MIKIISIMIGGAIGSVLRYGIFHLTQPAGGSNFPTGTLTANLAGAFLIGFFWSLFETSKISNEFRLLLFTGFLGGFTTFSTFARETTQLFKAGDIKLALGYVLTSNICGVLLVFAGYGLAKMILQHLRT